MESGGETIYAEPESYRDWPRTWRSDGYTDDEGLDAVVECTACGGRLAVKDRGAWGNGDGHDDECPETKPLPVPPHTEVIWCEDCAQGYHMPGWMDADGATATADANACPECGGELARWVKP